MIEIRLEERRWEDRENPHQQTPVLVAHLGVVKGVLNNDRKHRHSVKHEANKQTNKAPA
jgi:hypothetical protein